MGKRAFNERMNMIMDIVQRENHVTVKKLAYECDVSERTIRSDLSTLKGMYPHLTVKRGRGGGIFFIKPLEGDFE